MNISLDRRAATRRLYEELLDAGQGGNAPLMGQDLMNFLRGIEDPQHTFVKAIVTRAGVELPIVFNLKPEFYFANGQQVIGIEML